MNNQHRAEKCFNFTVMSHTSLSDYDGKYMDYILQWQGVYSAHHQEKWRRKCQPHRTCPLPWQRQVWQKLQVKILRRHRRHVVVNSTFNAPSWLSELWEQQPTHSSSTLWWLQNSTRSTCWLSIRMRSIFSAARFWLLPIHWSFAIFTKYVSE